MSEDSQRSKPTARPIVYSLIMTFAAILVLTLGGIWYTDHVANQNNQRWCIVLVAIDDAYKDANVTSPAGKRIAEAFHQQRIEFNC